MTDSDNKDWICEDCNDLTGDEVGLAWPFVHDQDNFYSCSNCGREVVLALDSLEEAAHGCSPVGVDRHWLGHRVVTQMDEAKTMAQLVERFTRANRRPPTAFEAERGMDILHQVFVASLKG